MGVGFNLNRDDAPALLAGVGANYAAVRAGTQDLTPLQISTLFQADYHAAVANARRTFQNFDRMTSARQVVLIDMMYNLGPGNFAEFKATINAVRTGNFLAASVHMLNSKWAKQVGNRARKNARLLSSGSPSDWDVLLKHIASEIRCYTMTATVTGESGSYSVAVVRCE